MQRISQVYMMLCVKSFSPFKIRPVDFYKHSLKHFGSLMQTDSLKFIVETSRKHLKYVDLQNRAVQK